MFESKSPSVNRISFAIGIVAAAITSILLLFLSVNLLATSITAVSILIVTYNFAKYTIEEFINRKIKLIYKFIYQTKASKREEFYQNKLLPQKNLDEVGEEVLQWADQRKKEMEKLEKNEAFRKEFLQNLSHEFKTPAFAIQGYLETLISGAMDNPEVSQKFLNNAYQNTERLINLISDLDEITRLESGKQQMHFQHFIVQDLVTEVFDALMIKTSTKNIKCLIKKGCEQPITVYADKEKIRQVITNLVDNAIKYGNKDGHVEASIYKTDNNSVLFEITDDGIGIAEEHLSRIFERFYRTDYGRSRNIGGTGLGLAICKHIIEAHGQIIHVRSTPGVGTTFGFTLSRN